MLFKKKETPPSAPGKGITKTLCLLLTLLFLLVSDYYVDKFFQKNVDTEFHQGQEYNFENFSITLDPGLILLETYEYEADRRYFCCCMDDSKKYCFMVDAVPVEQFSIDDKNLSATLLSQETKQQIIEWDLKGLGWDEPYTLCSNLYTNYIDLTILLDEETNNEQYVSYRLEIWNGRGYIFKLYCYIEDKETYQDSFSTWLHSILMIRDQ